MKRLHMASLALALLVPACALAQSAFDGTWKMDATTVHQSGGEPMVIALKGGMYGCNCRPPVTVKADGQDHPVKGHERFDAVAIKVINDHSIQRALKQDGKTVYDDIIAVAPDGKTATHEFTIHSGASLTTAKEVLKREAKGAPGSNAVAGSWRPDHVVSGSGASFDPTYKIEGDTVTSSDSAGGSYTAKLDGKPVPYMENAKADGTTVSVKMTGKNTLRETYAKNGNVVKITTMTIAPDGKSMKMVEHYMKTGVTATMIHHKV